MNRYTNYTPSTYNPLSMQEILMTPLAMRKQHDDLLAKQEMLKAGLVKVDPHDKYYEEAVRLKKDLESKIDQTTEQLSKEGFNNNMTAKTIALNREFNNLISPTGKLGMINEHKINLNKTYKDYIDASIKAGNSPEIANYWAKKALEEHIDVNKTPLYDDKGRVIDFKINRDPVKYIDVKNVINDLATKAGFNENTRSQAFDNIVTDSNTGMTHVKGFKGKQGSGNNYNQLKALSDYINAEVLDGNSDVKKSLDYNLQDINSVLGKTNKQIDIYKFSKSSKESESSIDNLHIPPSESNGSKDGSEPTAITDPTSTKTIGGRDGQVNFEGIGKPIVGMSSSLATSHEGTKFGAGAKPGTNLNKKQTYKDAISDPLLQKMYENTYNKLTKEGKIHKSRSINDPVVAKTIESYMNNVMPPVTLSNKIIRADINPSSDMFMGALVNKDADSRNATIQNDLEFGLRTMINPETNKPMTSNEFKEKNWKIEYVGYDSPLNFRGYKFQDPKQQVMAHRAIVKDKDGNIIGNTAVSRSHEEMNSPEFKAASLLTFSYRNAVLNSGEWTPIGTTESPSRNLKGAKIKYNYDGSVKIKKPNGELIKIKDSNGNEYEDLPTEYLSQYIFNNYQ